MLITYLIYEGVSTTLSIFGIKALSFGNAKKLIINQPKSLPIVDRYLRNQLGFITSTERWMAKKITNGINRITTYQAFNLLIALGLRKMREKQVCSISNTSRDNLSNPRWNNSSSSI